MPPVKDSTHSDTVSKQLDALSRYFNKDDGRILSEIIEPEVKKTVEEEDIAYSDNHKWATIEKKQALKQNRQLHKLRKKILPKLFWLSVAWVSFVALVLVFSRLEGGNFLKISDTVMIALLTTTTTTVLGLFAIAANWLFPKK